MWWLAGFTTRPTALAATIGGPLAVLLAAAVTSGPIVEELRAAAVLVRSNGIDPPAWAEQIGDVEMAAGQIQLRAAWRGRLRPGRVMYAATAACSGSVAGATCASIAIRK